MAYIGRSPLAGEVILMDSIESQFNGTLTNFNLTRTVSGTQINFYPVTSHQLLVSLGGVIQKPDITGNSGYKISYNQIIFAVAPPAGTNCFIVSYGNVLDVGSPADGTVSTDKLVDGSVTPVKLSSGGPNWVDGGGTSFGGPILSHDQSISSDYTIAANQNAKSFGPTMSINSGVTVTVSSGSYWTIS